MLSKVFGYQANLSLLITRIFVGIIFVFHGFAKLNMGVENVSAFFASVGIPGGLAIAWIVVLVEIVCGLLLIFGLLSRWAALLLSIVMIVAILTVKLKVGLIAAQGTGSELDFALLAGTLAVLLQGAGSYSIDDRVLKREV